MSCVGAIPHEFPDRRFDQLGGPLSGKTALDLFAAGDISGRPDFPHGGGNVVKGGEALSSGMQVDEVVVLRLREGRFGSQPEHAALDVCEPACRLRFGKVAITALIIFHARLSDERLS